MFKKMISLIGILLLVGTVYGETIYIGDLTIKDSNNYETIKTFTINKVENQKYILKFQHYGNINESMRVYLHLNNNLIYTIDDSNDGSGRYKKNISLDVTNYLNDGNNVLKLVGENLTTTEKGSNPYYKLKDTAISPSLTTKAPIPLGAVAISLIGVLILLVRHHENN